MNIKVIYKSISTQFIYQQQQQLRLNNLLQLSPQNSSKEKFMQAGIFKM